MDPCGLTGHRSDVRAVCAADGAHPTQQARPPEVHLHADSVSGGGGGGGTGEREADSPSLSHLVLLAGGRGEGETGEGAGGEGCRDQEVKRGAEENQIGTKPGQSR